MGNLGDAGIRPLGQPVFTTGDIENPWDGSYMGAQVESGVYVYHISITDADFRDAHVHRKCESGTLTTDLNEMRNIADHLFHISFLVFAAGSFVHGQGTSPASTASVDSTDSRRTE